MSGQVGRTRGEVVANSAIISGSSVTILSNRPNTRVGLWLRNTDGTDTLYLCVGGSAVLLKGIQLLPGEILWWPPGPLLQNQIPQGLIRAISTGTNSTACWQEFMLKND